MRAFLLIVIIFATLRLAMAGDSEPKWREYPSPNGRDAVRLREGWAIGNCKFNRAVLVDRKTGKQLFEFSSDEGGYDNDSVIWSPGSVCVAVYTRNHRMGEPIVMAILGEKPQECTLPEITLPHENNPKNDGRHVQSWRKPDKWLSDSELLLSDSGLIQQQRENGSRIYYCYDLWIKFDNDGHGVLKQVKQRAFVKEPRD